MYINKYLKTLMLTMLIITLTSVSSISNAFSNMNTHVDIIGESYIVMDMDTGEVIDSKNAETKRPVASTIKMLTSLVFSENTSKTETISFTEDSLKTKITSLNNLKEIKPGDTISSDDLMKAVMISSANDAAYLMADSVSGNYKDFVKLMNDKAKSLGMKNTTVVNPCGLESNAVDKDNTEINISTAYDIAILAQNAYKNPWIKETISYDKTKDIKIDISGDKISIPLRNKIVGEYGNVGGKTGNESIAGHCFVGFFERNNRSLVTVVLNSQYGLDGTNVFNDTVKLADFGYSYEKEIFKKAGEEICQIELNYRKFGIIGPKEKINVPVIATEDITYYKNDINDENLSINYNNKNKSAWRLANKDIELDLTLPNHETKIIGKVDLSRFDLFKMVVSPLIVLILGLLVLVFIVAYCIRLKNLRRKKLNKKSKNKKVRK